jgi:response regulator RpfG family c-di-GMP phosphodiesterase
MFIRRPEREVQEIALAAQLHDVGKIGVPDAILRKSGALSADDWGIVRRHADVGSDLVSAAPEFRSLAPIIRGHHEHWDGGGYPDGLSGEAIPLGARIVAVAEAFVTMTSEQGGTPRRDNPGAICELRRCAGTQFDPVLVEALCELVARDALAKNGG